MELRSLQPWLIEGAREWSEWDALPSHNKCTLLLGGSCHDAESAITAQGRVRGRVAANWCPLAKGKAARHGAGVADAPAGVDVAQAAAPLLPVYILVAQALGSVLPAHIAAASTAESRAPVTANAELEGILRRATEADATDSGSDGDE